MGWEIAFGLVFLMAAWHGMKHGVPRAMRAVGNRRKTSIAKWKAKHPKAPASARWVAGTAHGIAALRWGPGYFKREFSQAFRDAWDDGKKKYKLAPADDLTDPTGVKNCADCKGKGVKRGKPCPSCVERQRQRNEEWAKTSPLAQRMSKPPPTPPAPAEPVPNGRPNLRAVPTPPEPTAPTAPVRPQQRSNDMTTIEVTSPETLKAFMEAKVQSAAAELEDAQADARRAEAAVAEIERTAAALTTLELRAEDVAQVKALMEPDQQWLAAAQSRIAAADQRLAGAKAALTMATRHVELQANGAAGRFYRAG